MQIGQPMLPLDHNLFNFGSWMGGDRDGNPFVTPETTRDVVITARLAAVNLYFSAIEKLMFELSIWRCNKELQVELSPLGTGLTILSMGCSLQRWASSQPDRT